MSQTAISRIRRAFELKPHVVRTWKLSTDPLFIDKARDVVGLYLDPPAKALVLCVDEKSGMQALDRTAPTLPITPTTPARRTHDYVRHDPEQTARLVDETPCAGCAVRRGRGWAAGRRTDPVANRGVIGRAATGGRGT